MAPQDEGSGIFESGSQCERSLASAGENDAKPPQFLKSGISQHLVNHTPQCRHFALFWQGLV
jgi:hypothetical protein